MNIGFPKKITNVFHHGHMDKYRRVNPDRHWRRLVVACAILVVVIAAASLYVYLKVSRGEFFSSSESNGAPAATVDRKKIDDAVSFFEAKRTRFNAEKAAPPVFVDPGL